MPSSFASSSFLEKLRPPGQGVVIFFSVANDGSKGSLMMKTIADPCVQHIKIEL